MTMSTPCKKHKNSDKSVKRLETVIVRASENREKETSIVENLTLKSLLQGPSDDDAANCAGKNLECDQLPGMSKRVHPVEETVTHVLTYANTNLQLRISFTSEHDGEISYERFQIIRNRTSEIRDWLKALTQLQDRVAIATKELR
ncbi:hypothetical protein RUM44_007404 [Polyplax serrata]|uniref:PH domain-containing protein n=1 Tax=Polyplax serrata TaxID=468196 RepID=A0ABR1B0K9_POLSC